MPTQLRIDQAGLPAGEPGRSRTDGKADGSLVTLTNTGSGSTTTFALLWTPPGDSGAVESLEATEDPKVWTFSPTAGKHGSYLVELVENAGLFTERRERRVIVMRTARLGLVIPALNERGDTRATLEDTRGDEFIDNNATDYADEDLNELAFASWWRAMHELVVQVDAIGSGVAVTHCSGTGLTRKTYGSLADALAAEYPSSAPSAAVYDIPPNAHDPTAGPITLDTVVTYVLRSAAGIGAVVLPEMTLQSSVQIEGCIIANELTGGTLTLRDAQVSADITPDYLTARDSAIDGDVEVSSEARFDRCAIGEDVTITNTAGTGLVAFANCTFGGPMSIVFTGGSPGVVRMDSRTHFLFDAADGAITNGSILVEELGTP